MMQSYNLSHDNLLDVDVSIPDIVKFNAGTVSLEC